MSNSLLGRQQAGQHHERFRLIRGEIGQSVLFPAPVAQQPSCFPQEAIGSGHQWQAKKQHIKHCVTQL